MKPLLVRLDAFFRGFGGVLLISLIGIVILFFGGILPLNNRISDLEEQTRELEERIAFARQTKPLLESIDRRRKAMRDQIHQRVPVEPFPSDQIGQLPARFLEELGSSSLQAARVDIQLPVKGNRDHALLLVRGQTEFDDLPGFFSALSQWPHWEVVTAFSLRAGESALECTFTLSIPLH